jgi:hypothetical protein
MSQSVEHAIRRSSEDFVDLVWPVIAPALGREGLELMPVECEPDTDMLATAQERGCERVG